MMLNKIHNVFFVGVGGIGMSALARYFIANDKSVAGYDRTCSEITSALKKEGVVVIYKDKKRAIPKKFRVEKNKKNTLVVYTPAVSDDNIILSYFKQKGYTIKKRSEVLGMITKDMECIAVAGTHGKTSISSLTAYILYYSAKKVNAFLGGILKNYDKNILLSDSNVVVTEADEYDRSFLHLYPDIAVVSAVDPDHLDVYGTYDKLKNAFADFVDNISDKGVLLTKKDIDIEVKNSNIKRYTYSLNDKTADFYADNISIKDGRYCFDIYLLNDHIEGLVLNIPGRINVENAVAAIALAYLKGAVEHEVKEALESFKGVKRRFDVIIRSDQLVYIDDYAHHPDELNATIGSVKEMFPERKITGIFQPHLYSRTKDLAKQFAESLGLLDELILLDIYPAREEPIAGVDSGLIFEKTGINDKVLSKKEDVLNILKKKDINVLITMGAGDIDRLVNPIKQYLMSAYDIKQNSA